MNTFEYNRVYLIRFKLIERSTYLNNYILPSLSTILGEQNIKNVAVEEDEITREDVMLLFVQTDVINKLIQFCVEEDIIKEHRDISEQLLTSNQEPVIIKMMKSEEYSHLFERFFLNTRFRYCLN